MAACHLREKLHGAWFGAVVLCFGLVASVATGAATTNAVSKPQPERWLLVFDTSDTMERRARAVEGVVGELLASSMHGQITAGSQVGIWTYDKELRAGVVPLLTWNPAQSNMVAGRAAQFVGTLKYRGKSNLDAVLPELNRLVKESRRLTVVIFSDGAQNITGTLFDEALNEAYAAARPDLKNTRMPLITVLRSERGKFIGQNVSFAPWPISFPPFEPEPVLPVEPVKPKPAEPVKSIIIGGGAKPVQPPTNQLVLAPAPEIRPVTEIPVAQPPAPEPVAPPDVPKVEPVVANTPVAAIAELPPPESPVPVAITSADHTPQVQSEAVEAETFLSRRWLLILGIGCMWVAIIMALLVARRSRRATGASLITQSFDRHRR